MPEISRFLGIVIAIYYNDHSPRHFHAKYGELEAVFAIETGEVLTKTHRTLGVIFCYRN